MRPRGRWPILNLGREQVLDLVWCGERAAVDALGGRIERFERARHPEVCQDVTQASAGLSQSQLGLLRRLEQKKSEWHILWRDCRRARLRRSPSSDTQDQRGSRSRLSIRVIAKLSGVRAVT